MSVGIKVGPIVTEIGASTFLNAFFSTVVALLEEGKRGAVYPGVSIDLYKGHVDSTKLPLVIKELQTIQKEFLNHPPSAIVWDLEDRSRLPPWGNVIAPTITSMANYFVSSGGRNLFEVFLEVFTFADKKKKSVDIVEVQEK